MYIYSTRIHNAFDISDHWLYTCDIDTHGDGIYKVRV